MVKLLALLHKRPEMTTEEFCRYWREIHGPIAATFPGLRKYVQNYPGAEVVLSPSPWDGTAELWFDSLEALQQSLASPEGQAVIADHANFLDTERTTAVVFHEVSIL